MKKLLSKNQGITLLSLVITIIILLILAGITISQLKINSFFEKANQANSITKEKQKLENITLNNYEKEISKYIYNGREQININDYRDNLICDFNMNSIQNNIILDNSGNNIDGQILGDGFEQKTDIDGSKYIHLDGNTYIVTDEINELAGDTEKTIMCWFRTDITSNWNGIMNIGALNAAKTGLSAHLNNGFIRFDTGNYTYCYDPQVIFAADNEWHFICVTYDKKTIALYLDNRPIFATNASLNTTVPKIGIGTLSLGDFIFNGDITNFRAYNKGLNFEQIYAVYTNLKNN